MSDDLPGAADPTADLAQPTREPLPGPPTEVAPQLLEPAAGPSSEAATDGADPVAAPHPQPANEGPPTLTWSDRIEILRRELDTAAAILARPCQDAMDERHREGAERFVTLLWEWYLPNQEEKRSLGGAAQNIRPAARTEAKQALHKHWSEHLERSVVSTLHAVSRLIVRGDGPGLLVAVDELSRQDFESLIEGEPSERRVSLRRALEMIVPLRRDDDAPDSDEYVAELRRLARWVRFLLDLQHPYGGDVDRDVVAYALHMMTRTGNERIPEKVKGLLERRSDLLHPTADVVTGKWKAVQAVLLDLQLAATPLPRLVAGETAVDEDRTRMTRAQAVEDADARARTFEGMVAATQKALE